jgi:hypothetical protein
MVKHFEVDELFIVDFCREVETLGYFPTSQKEKNNTPQTSILIKKIFYFIA